MFDGTWPILAIVVIVIAWVLSKVFFYMRKSDAEWQQVDKSKLRKWEDDED